MEKSLGLYPESVIIQLDIIPASFQLDVMSYSWKTSLWFLLGPIMNRFYLLPINVLVTVKSSSHTPDVETTSEYISPPKLSCEIILFLTVDPSQSPQKIFSQFQLNLVELVSR